MRRPISRFSVTSHCITVGPGTLPLTNQAMLSVRHFCDPLMNTVDWIMFVLPESLHKILMYSLALTSSQVSSDPSSKLGKDSAALLAASSYRWRLGWFNETALAHGFTINRSSIHASLLGAIVTFTYCKWIHAWKMKIQSTVWCHYNADKFHPNPHKVHRIARR